MAGDANRLIDKAGIMCVGSRARILYMVAIAISCILLFGSTTFGATSKEKKPSDPCKEADALLKAGHEEEAKKLYLSILASNPTEVCAITGLKKIPAEGKKAHEIGKAFQQAEDLKQAKENFKTAIEKNPAQAESIAEYKKIHETSDPFKKIRFLDSIGDQTEARKVYMEILKDDPTVELPKDLEHLREGGSWPGAWELWNRIERELGADAADLLVAAAKVICLYIFVLVIFSLYRFFKRLSLNIVEFKGVKDDEKLGESFVAYLGERYYHLQEGSRSNTILFVSGSVQAIELPAELAFPTKIGWLKPVLTFFQTIAITESSLELKGLLVKSDKGPVTACLQLGRGNKKICSKINLRQEDFAGTEMIDSQANPIAILAEVAAIWLIFELQKPEYLSKWKKVWEKVKVRLRCNEQKGFQLLGTKDWFSYALFRAGHYAEKACDYGRAKDLYVRALSLDNTFRSARVNLARLLWKDGDEKKDKVLKSLAVYHLEKVIEVTMSKIKESSTEIYTDPSTYAAYFNLAVWLFHLGRYANALDMTVPLLNMIEEAQKKDPMAPELRRYLDSIKPMAQAVNRGLRVLTGYDGTARKEMIGSENENTLIVSPLLHYNLACSYSICAEKTTDDSENYVTKALKHLEIALWLAPSDKAKVRMIDDAKTDRSMKFIRTKTEKEFHRILATATYTPLAELSIVGIKYAEELAVKCGVKTMRDLLTQTAPPALCEGIVNQLKVSDLLVKRWHDVAGLSQIEGIGVQEANFLDRAGVYSTAQLASQNSDALLGLLESLNKLNIGTITVSKDRITKWIEDAKQIVDRNATKDYDAT